MPDPVTSIFLSYDKKDQNWAEWVYWQLNDGGYPTTRCWDLDPGSNRAVEWHTAIEKADHTVVLLSPAYLDRLEEQPGWSTALTQDPGGRRGKLIPVRIQECNLSGLFSAITAIDLFDLVKEEARDRLLAGINRKRHALQLSPVYPGKAQQSLSRTAPPFPGNPQSVIEVPYRRNPLFSGREELLKYLSDRFTTDETGFPISLALCGVSGIGKTQIAIEYAYRYRDRYQYILWVHADSRDKLGRDMMTLANRLTLQESDQTPAKALQEVKRWLETTGQWLLILDHVNDLSLIHSYIPQKGKGHILLTTCTQITAGVAHSIIVDKMTVEEGIRFLLNRAKIARPSTSLDAHPIDRATAHEIYQVMDGLPLALDQVGAYIEESTRSLKHYLVLYKQQPAMFLKRRGGVKPDHPASVAEAWVQYFAMVEKTNRIAAELLQFCTFLDPHAIPEEIFIGGSVSLGATLSQVATNPIELDEAIKELRKYSFIHRDPDTMMLSIHPLMQIILQDKMDERTKNEWAERAVRAVKQVFPDGKLPARHDCQRYIVHVQTCIKHIDRWGMVFPDAIDLIAIEKQILDYLAQPDG